MNKRAVLYLSLVILVLISVYVFTAGDPTVKQAALPSEMPLLPSQHYGNAMQMQENRKGLQQFIEERFSGSEGIYTNWLDTDQSAEVATGHELLSESAGLIMRYYTLNGLQEAFDSEWERTKQVLDMDTGFSYRYSPKQQRKYTINASVDDLRLIRALHEASLVFKDTRYKTEADTYGSRFYKYNIKNGYLYDFYDSRYNTTNDFITLCYIDLKTLSLLPDSNKHQQRLVANMQTILEDGYLSDEFPFYESRYMYKTDTYSSDNIHTVESLLAILSLAEVNRHNPKSIEYLKKHVNAGTLYGQYTKNGTPANDIRSTAIYAITAMIGSQVGDGPLYEDSIRRMNEFQIHDAANPLKDGFGYGPTLQAYSFDNLMALLAYSY